MGVVVQKSSMMLHNIADWKEVMGLPGMARNPSPATTNKVDSPKRKALQFAWSPHFTQII
jgi:hypothetical protein